MVIISDASPIIALHNINELHLLKGVYQELTITDIVKQEVEIPLPAWIRVVVNYDKALFESLSLQVDEGEASAIALAKLTPDSTLIIDERRGRRIARELGIDIIGVLGVIVKAKKMEIIDLHEGIEMIEKLSDQGFRISPRVLSIVRRKLEE